MGFNPDLVVHRMINFECELHQLLYSFSTHFPYILSIFFLFDNINTLLYFFKNVCPPFDKRKKQKISPVLYSKIVVTSLLLFYFPLLPFVKMLLAQTPILCTFIAHLLIYNYATRYSALPDPAVLKAYYRSCT